MKKLLFGFLAIMLFSVSVNAQELTKLNEDIDFVTYLKNHNDFISKTTDFNSLQSLLVDEKIDEKELLSFYTLFQTDEKGFNAFLLNQADLYKRLNLKYSFDKYSEEELKEYFTQEILEINNGTAKLAQNDCLTDYNLQIAYNGSVAVVAGYGCLALGPLSPGCMAAVAAGNVIADIQAYRAYKKCLSGGK
ncbi:Hypothetical protein precursor [Flavobacterium indicum GPTSA100-9 = DSM 17447]|uniref:Secreted protein n=1 Tax=Flavobacterium indicum (strain DSM 17447 / CIP 109464 / GPTSA100-9) TaxID=1094466 RepID=H8XRA6_FLAIG|nr:hypothetical protein [Flavobacterium indicum]CCG54340.1 Hypothetical protein precursor [Flavobacterium indicum GPTSA100-9 = DSM 17447]